MEKSSFDIKKMSRETGVSVFFIKTALGIKSKDKHPQRGTKNTSSVLEGLYVSKKQIELSLLEIEKATTVTEAKRAYRYAPAEIKASALIKWCGLTTTVKEAKEFCVLAPSDSPLITFARRKLVEIFLFEVEKAKTVEEVKRVCEYDPENWEASALAFKKQAQLVSTIEEAKKVYDGIPIDSEAEVIVCTKWAQLVSTIEEARAAHRYINGGSKGEAIILKRIATFYGFSE